jgi:hypothetical protein
MRTATGTFDVTLAPLPVENMSDADQIHRQSLGKTFHGDLRGTSKGQMLAAGTATRGSAVYVAVERVSATLGGKAGTFALHHTGIMNRGAPSLSIAVVPDSGTGELTGITGTMTIDIKEKTHYYTFSYDLL